jgi:hypothetical protein
MNQLKIKFLEEKLIKYIGFVSEPIMNHLIGTANILKEYGAPNYLIDAGLFHSIYGEASSRNVPKNKYLTREELVSMIGKDAEEIVYEFSSIESPRTENINNYPDGQLKEDLILLDNANNEQMKMKKE